jgi:hypothetical protein
MGIGYKIIIVQHALDGINLLLQQVGTTQNVLILSAIANAEDYLLPFGITISDSYRGIPALLVSAPEDLAFPLHKGDEEFPIIVPRKNRAIFSYGELLDRGRTYLTRWAQVYLLVDYSTLMQNLPALNEKDSLVCYWEVRDLLTDRHLKAFKYISEKVHQSSCIFQGVNFYTRNNEHNLEMQELKVEIEAAALWQSRTELIHIN